MALRFSPLDVDATIWFTAEESRVETYPDSDRVRTWFDRGPTRDYPLTGFDHQEDLSVEYASAPRLTDADGNALNGRPTIAFPAGSYLKGATRAWTGNWRIPEPNTPWSFDAPYGGVPEAQTYWYWNQGRTYRYLNKAVPSRENHGFVLARVYPSSTSSSDSSWLAEPTGYSYENRTPAPRRPVIWSPRVYDDMSPYPGLRIWLWDADAPSSPGTLAFYGDAIAAVEPYNYPSPLPDYEVVDYGVPFDRFGRWTLFEWKTTNEIVDGVSYRFSYLFLNGRQASKVICPSFAPSPEDSPDYDLAFDFSLFGEPQGEGSWNDIRASKASGNVAEVVMCRRALSDDEAARTRAWLCRRWGLEELLVGQPYASLPEIPGGDADLPWAFPGVRPSSRTYVPGAYSNSAFASVGGVEQRVRHSRAPLAGDRLSLSYSALSEADAGRFLSHYSSTLGGFRTFGLRPETLVNLGVVARHLNRARSRGEYAPRGSSWAYASEPVVRNRLRDVNELTVELELLAEPFQIEIQADGGAASFSSQMDLSVERAIGGPVHLSIDVDGQLFFRAFFGDPAVSVASDATLLLDRALDGVATLAIENPSILMTVYFDGDAGTVEFASSSDLVYETPAVTALWEFDGTLGYLYDNAAVLPLAAAGSPSFDSTVVRSGSSSVYFNGYVGSVLEYAEYQLPLSYGLGDFCVQCFLRVPASLVADEGYVTALMFGARFSIDYDGSIPAFGLYAANGAPFVTVSAAADVWHHVAAYRVDGVFYFAVNGSVVASSAGAFDFEADSEGRRFIVGDWIADGDYSYLGWVDRLIVEFGSSPYGSSNFTPPS